jgi:hypothetical protein
MPLITSQASDLMFEPQAFGLTAEAWLEVATRPSQILEPRTGAGPRDLHVNHLPETVVTRPSLLQKRRNDPPQIRKNLIGGVPVRPRVLLPVMDPGPARRGLHAWSGDATHLSVSLSS